jgi:hypothetical protein
MVEVIALARTSVSVVKPRSGVPTRVTAVPPPVM